MVFTHFAPLYSLKKGEKKHLLKQLSNTLQINSDVTVPLRGNVQNSTVRREYIVC